MPPSPSDLPPWLRRSGAAPRGDEAARGGDRDRARRAGVRRGRGRGFPVRAPGRRGRGARTAPAGLSAGGRCAPPPPGGRRRARAHVAPRASAPNRRQQALSPLPDKPPLDEGARTQALRAFAEKKAPELRDCVAEPDRGPSLKLGAAFEIGSDGAVDFVQILGADGSPKDVKRATPTA